MCQIYYDDDDASVESVAFVKCKNENQAHRSNLVKPLF